MKDLFIPVLLGTARRGRESEKVAKFVLEEVKKHGIKTRLIDIRGKINNYTIPSWEKNTKTKWWSNIMSKADGLIVICPEYNHSFPGELKIFMDGIFAEYTGKPAMVCGVSSGGLGGARVVESLRIFFGALGLFTIKTSVYFSNVPKLFTKTGKIKDISYTKRLKGALDELAEYANLLKKK